MDAASDDAMGGLSRHPSTGLRIRTDSSLDDMTSHLHQVTLESPRSIKKRLKGQRHHRSTSSMSSSTSFGMSFSRPLSRRTSRAVLRLEDEWSLTTLTQLKAQFENADEDGNGSLCLEEFLRAFGTHSQASDEYLRNLFQKIDASDDGDITWDEFATYMHLEYQKKHDASQRSKRVMLSFPAKQVITPHRGRLSRMLLHNKQLITLGENGLLCSWSPTAEVAPIKRQTLLQMKTQAQSSSSKPAWATDIVVVENLHKIVVASGSRELWFFDMKTLQPVFVITHLEDTPLKLSCAQEGNEAATIIVGDHTGCLCALHFPPNAISATGFKHTESGRQGDVPQVSLEDLMRADSLAYGGTTYVRWSVHGDWVVEVIYSPVLKTIVSASNDEDTALAIGEIIQPALEMPNSLPIDPNGPSAHLFHSGAGLRQNPGQLTFAIRKGVKTICLSEEHNVVATGGLDRIIRLWNPLVNFRPTGVLQGHSSPIEQIAIQDATARLYSISSDCELKIWSMQDMSCISSMSVRQHGIAAETQALLFNDHAMALVAFADRMYTMHITQGATGNEQELSHSAPLVAMLYNPRFKHILTGCRQGVVKVWDIESGDCSFEFSVQQGRSTAALTTFTLDSTSRRLVTSQLDGTISVWNYNNGQLLRSFVKPTSKEVTAMVYAEIGSLKFVVAGGWDRQLFVYQDKMENDLLAAVVKPEQQRWQHAPRHSDDIVSMDFAPPHMLVSAGYDGQVLVWNMSSATVSVRLQLPQQQKRASSAAERVKAVRPLVAVRFLRHAMQVKTDIFDMTAELPLTIVGLEAKGVLHFWNHRRQGAPLHSIVLELDDALTTCTSLAISPCNEHIFVGTSAGFVLHIALPSPAPEIDADTEKKDLCFASSWAQATIATWRTSLAAVRALCCVDDERIFEIPPDAEVGVPAGKDVFVSESFSLPLAKVTDDDKDEPDVDNETQAEAADAENDSSSENSDEFDPQPPAQPPLQYTLLLLAGSDDGRTRLWTARGELIAALGQADEYEIYDRETHQHPNRPREVVEAEEIERQRRQQQAEAEAAREEQARIDAALGIVDEGGSSSSEEDEDFLPSRPTLRRPRQHALVASGRSKPSSAAGSRHLTGKASAVRKPSRFTASSASRPMTRGTTAHAAAREGSANSSLFSMRQSPKRIYSATRPLSTATHEFRRHRQESEEFASRMTSIGKPDPSKDSFAQFTSRSAGNWKRHMTNVPYRLKNDKVFLGLPYHDIDDPSPVQRPSAYTKAKSAPPHKRH